MKRYFIKREAASCIAVWSGFALFAFFLYLINDNVGHWIAWILDVAAFVGSVVAGIVVYWMIIVFQVVLGIAREEHKKDKMTWDELGQYEGKD